MKFKRSYLLFLPIIFFFGCAGGGKTNITKPVLTDLSNWPQQFEQNYHKIKTFEGKARLTVESMEFSGHVSVKVYWVEPDTLFIHAEGPLGLDIGKMYVGSERFIIHNQFENRFLSGSVNNPYLSRFLQTGLYLKDLRLVLLGRPMLFSSNLILADSNHGVFRKRSGGEDYRYVVNPATGLLESWEKFEKNQVVVKQEFKNYHQIDNVYFPYLIQITLPQKQQRISIFYREIVLNNPIDSKIYTIEIGPKVKQLNLN